MSPMPRARSAGPVTSAMYACATGMLAPATPASGERPEDARRDTARGNRKGSGQSSRSRAPASAAFGADPAEPADELARLAQERRAQAWCRRLEVAVAQRAQIARELTKPRAAVPRARGGERLRLAHALLDHPQRQVERPPVTAPGRRTRTRPG